MSEVNILPQKPLGRHGLFVSKQGLGCLPMSPVYGGDTSKVEATSLETIAKALELGVNFFDTSWVHQPFYPDDFEGERVNETILGKAIAIYGRSKFIIATNADFFARSPGDVDYKFESKTPRPGLRDQINASLARLGTDYIDLLFVNRVDANTSIEDTVRVMGEFVKEGKVKYIGLSNPTAAEIQSISLTFYPPVSAIQIEISLHNRDDNLEVIARARELGIGIVVYSPLDRGLLTGTVAHRMQLKEHDWRMKSPRFTATNLQANIPSPKFINLAAKKNLTPAQLALAWVHALGEDMVPIPGTNSPKHVEENVQAAFVNLSQQEFRLLETIVPRAEGDSVPQAAWGDKQVKLGVYDKYE